MYGYNDRNERKNNNRQFQEASSMRKACIDTQFFWDMVNRNRATFGNGGMRKPVNKPSEEKILFGKNPVENVEQGFIDDSIPVERSGPRADEIPVLSNFQELEGQIPPYTSRNIELMHYVTPTPIQKHAVPLGLAGVDLMCCAQTGSGKTFSFMLPVVTAMDRDSMVRMPVPEGLPAKMLPSSDALTDTADTPEEENSNNGANNPHSNFQLVERISIDQRGALPLAVVLAPTRELASQIHLDARRLIYGSHLKAVCVYGGNDLRTQLVELSTGCDLIVATPGRLNDLVDRGCVSLSMVSLLVLDEADRMLDMGFEPQIRKIIQESDMPPTGQRQTFLFSATFPDEIQTLAREFLHNYVWIGVGRVGSTVDNIKQQVLCASSDPNDKIKLLLGAIDQTNGRTLVFVQKRRTASWLCDCLRGQCHIKAEEIHGDRTQAQREHALKQFRDGHIRILVATDVAARGLDVPAVTHVIQFDLPLSSEDFDTYVHRIGRTGRAGMGGLATALFVPGRELGEGNGKIAPQILRLLQENNQEIPDWFANLDDHNPGYNNRGGGNYKQRQPYGGGGGYQNNYNNKFGGRDVRGDQQSYTYDHSGGYGGMQQQGGYQSSGYPQGGYQQQGYQQRGGRGGGSYGNNSSYGQQQQGYQGGRGGAYGAESQGYARRPQQQSEYRSGSQQYGAHQTSSYASSPMTGYGAQYGAPEAIPSIPAAAPAYGADPSLMNGAGYYDPYSGSYVPSAPAPAVESAYGGNGVDALNGQFGGMSIQPPTAYGSSRAPAGQYMRGAPQGAGGRGNPRAMDSSAAPYVPAGTVDPYYQQQAAPMVSQAQYTQGYQKPTYAPAGGAYSQQMPPQMPQHAQYGAPHSSGGYGAATARYAQQAPVQQQMQHGYASHHQGQHQGQYQQSYSPPPYAYSRVGPESAEGGADAGPSADASS